MKKNKNVSEKEAFQRIQKICSLQEKCKQDIEQKLKIWKIEIGSIKKILDLLEKNNFINEKRYAIAFVKDKFRFNKWGKIKIHHALSQKRIPEELIQSALDEIDEREYLELLKQEIKKKLNSLKGKSNTVKKKKLLSLMLSRGFENGKIFEMLNTILK